MTSACWRQPSWIWKESLATALLIDIDFTMAGLAYVQHSVSENCLQRAVFAAYAHRWQKAALRGTEIGVNFHIFSKHNKHNNTVRKTRHEAFLNSNFYWDWIKNTQEIHQWKSLKLDQLSYTEHSREHFGLPTERNYTTGPGESAGSQGPAPWREFWDLQHIPTLLLALFAQPQIFHSPRMGRRTLWSF